MSLKFLHSYFFEIPYSVALWFLKTLLVNLFITRTGVPSVAFFKLKYTNLLLQVRTIARCKNIISRDRIYAL